ncbi:MAG: HemK2/MTQ2 family protein methyltransferase [Candidatus Hermodarchaeota archaeon]
MNNIKRIPDPIIISKFKSVYSPSDDSYLIIDYFKENISNSHFDGLEFNNINNILDMGTGSGIIAIFFLLIKKVYSKFNPKIYASDILEEAIICSKSNEKINHYEDDITFFHSDLFNAFPKNLKNTFNIIVFNPPYLPSIEKENNNKKVPINFSWDGGDKGIEVLERFIKQVIEFIDITKRNGAYIYFISSSRADIKELDDLIRDVGFKRKVVKRKHIFFEDILLNKLELNI